MFKASVKSGEVQVATHTKRDRNGCLTGQSDRPRLLFEPSENACGPITWIQQVFFPDLRKHWPGFIQGMTPSEIKTVIKEHVCKLVDPVCISSDGSAFDSHQHHSLMDAIDTRIWETYRPRLLAALQQHPDEFPFPETTLKGLMFQALQHDSTLLVDLPGWSKLVDKPYRANALAGKYLKGLKGRDFASIRIKGTTFSGQPVKTTLGNTARTKAYHEYACFKAGIPDEHKFVVASGDDACVWISRRYHAGYLEQIDLLTAKNTNRNQRGLGQCIKEIKVSHCLDMDFCSKVCFGSSWSEWVLLRDAAKAWREKLSYVGSNREFHLFPERHVVAMRASAKAEVNCPILDDFYSSRLQRIARKIRSSPNPRACDAARLDFIDRHIGCAVSEEALLLKRQMYQQSKRFEFASDHPPLTIDQSLFFLRRAGWSPRSLLECFYNGSQGVVLA